jgi:competence protein ComEA
MFNLTPTEKRVIIVLVLLIGGSGIIRLIKPMTVRTESYDYAQADSIFARRTELYFKQAGSRSPDRQQEYLPGGPGVLKQEDQKLPERGSIDLNRASPAELELLPHIGPAMAKRIVAFRNSNGNFKSLQDLMKVKGIGKKTYALIKPYLKEPK